MQVVATAEEPAVAAASRRMGPVRPRVLGDRVGGDGPPLLLLPVEGGDRWSRRSSIGWDPLFTIESPCRIPEKESEERLARAGAVPDTIGGALGV